MILASDTLHLWRVFLPDFMDHVTELAFLLNEAERQRADRLHAAIHRERFIIARGFLKKIIQLYTGISPAAQIFDLGGHGKPFLKGEALQFNVSHSHDWAVYGFCQHKALGIDVEKNEQVFKEGIAKRFFHEKEYHELMNLPAVDRSAAFYNVWTKKEAVIKAIGQDILQHLKDFTVHPTKKTETISMNSNHIFYLYCYDVAANYPVAVASDPSIKTYQHWVWRVEDYQLLKTVEQPET